MSKTAEERLKQSPSHFINRAIEMIKDADINTGLYNGIVSLLQYAKESDEYAKLKTSELEKENQELREFLNNQAKCGMFQSSNTAMKCDNCGEHYSKHWLP